MNTSFTTSYRFFNFLYTESDDPPRYTTHATLFLVDETDRQTGVRVVVLIQFESVVRVVMQRHEEK